MAKVRNDFGCGVFCGAFLFVVFPQLRSGGFSFVFVNFSSAGKGCIWRSSGEHNEENHFPGKDAGWLWLRKLPAGMQKIASFLTKNQGLGLKPIGFPEKK